MKTITAALALSLLIVRAEPATLPVEIFLMKDGMSIDVGQLSMQGASWQYRQRSASLRASLGESAGFFSSKTSSMQPSGSEKS